MNKRMVKIVGLTALSTAVLFTGCGQMNPSDTLVTIKTEDGATDTISLGYGNFVARYQQSMYDQYLLAYYGEDMWTSDLSGSGSTLQEETKDGVLEDMEAQYLTKLHAADYGVELSDEQTTAIADAAAEFIADNSEETLEEMGATEEYVQQYLEYRTYYSLVKAAAMEAADADITDDEAWMRTFTYVVFDTTGSIDDDGNLVEYTDDELASLKEQAESLAAAEDFDAEVESLGVTSSTYSYLKGEEEDSTMDMSLITAAESLAEGEVSAVIEVEDAGYYVIRMDADHDEDASASKREELQETAFEDLMDSWIDSIEWTVNEKAWAKVTFDSLFTAVAEDEEDTDTEETTEDTETTEETSDEAESADELTEDATEETTGEPAAESTDESTDTTADNTEETVEEAE